jgi:hypothetical protein
MVRPEPQEFEAPGAPPDPIPEAAPPPAATSPEAPTSGWYLASFQIGFAHPGATEIVLVLKREPGLVGEGYPPFLLWINDQMAQFRAKNENALHMDRLQAEVDKLTAEIKGHEEQLAKLEIQKREYILTLRPIQLIQIREEADKVRVELMEVRKRLEPLLADLQLFRQAFGQEWGAELLRVQEQAFQDARRRFHEAKHSMLFSEGLDALTWASSDLASIHNARCVSAAAQLNVLPRRL